MTIHTGLNIQCCGVNSEHKDRDSEEEEVENQYIKALAIAYSRIRKYMIKARSLDTRDEEDQLEKRIKSTIVHFSLLKAREQDNERRAAIEQSVEDLKKIREEIGDGEGIIDLEKLKKIRILLDY